MYLSFWMRGGRRDCGSCQEHKAMSSGDIDYREGPLTHDGRLPDFHAARSSSTSRGGGEGEEGSSGKLPRQFVRTPQTWGTWCLSLEHPLLRLCQPERGGDCGKTQTGTLQGCSAKKDRRSRLGRQGEKVSNGNGHSDGADRGMGIRTEVLRF